MIIFSLQRGTMNENQTERHDVTGNEIFTQKIKNKFEERKKNVKVGVLKNFK